MLVITATAQGFIRRAMVLCQVFFLSACITQPTTTGTAETGTELRMAIPNEWQQIEQIRLPSMNMSLYRSPAANDHYTEIRLEHHRVPVSSSDDLAAIEKAIQGTGCPGSQPQRFFSGNEGGFASQLYISECTISRPLLPRVTLTKYLTQRDQFRISVSLVSQNSETSTPVPFPERWVKRWSTALGGFNACPRAAPPSECGPIASAE